MVDYASRFNNQIRYDSPSFGGFYGGVSYAFEQNAGVGDKLTAVQVGYKAGPMQAVLGHQNEKTKSKFTALSGSYDFGVASLSAGYNQRSGTTSDDNEYTFGVNVPVGAVNLSAGYAASETESSAGVTTAKASGFGLGATYSLSKRTRLYAGYRSHDVKNAAGSEDHRHHAVRSGRAPRLLIVTWRARNLRALLFPFDLQGCPVRASDQRLRNRFTATGAFAPVAFFMVAQRLIGNWACPKGRTKAPPARRKARP